MFEEKKNHTRRTMLLVLLLVTACAAGYFLYFHEGDDAPPKEITARLNNTTAAGSAKPKLQHTLTEEDKRHLDQSGPKAGVVVGSVSSETTPVETASLDTPPAAVVETEIRPTTAEGPSTTDVGSSGSDGAPVEEPVQSTERIVSEEGDVTETAAAPRGHVETGMTGGAIDGGDTEASATLSLPEPVETQGTGPADHNETADVVAAETSETAPLEAVRVTEEEPALSAVIEEKTGIATPEPLPDPPLVKDKSATTAPSRDPKPSGKAFTEKSNIVMGSNKGAYVINALSTQDPDKTRELLDALISLPHTVYAYRTKVKGKDWYRIRVGFFPTHGEAERVGLEIAAEHGLPSPWIVKPGPQELKKYTSVQPPAE
jgi:hypothetical protein